MEVTFSEDVAEEAHDSITFLITRGREVGITPKSLRTRRPEYMHSHEMNPQEMITYRFEWAEDEESVHVTVE